jgi:competence ComEA-like helix-hairpin-helix protein
LYLKWNKMKSQPKLVNINQADLETLAQLPGIGPTLAERIIEYRETAGSFENPAELSEIYGISEAMVNDILSFITTGDSPEQHSGPSGEDSGVEDGEVGLAEEETEEDESRLDEEQSTDEEEPPAEDERAAPDPDQAAPDTEQGALSEEEDLAALTSEIRLLPAEPVEAELVAGERELAEEGSSAEPAGTGSESSAGGDGPEDGPEDGLEGEHEVRLEDGPEDGPGLVTASNNDAPDHDRGDHVRTTGVQRSSDNLASRRGCSLQAVVAGAILGGLFGLTLTTLILYLLNGGMLQFAGARSLRNLENDTTTRLSSAQAGQDDLALQMQTLQGLVEELNEAVIEVATQQAEISKSISDTDEEVIELEKTVLDMEEKISTVVEAAENFNIFLGGLQELLDEMALTPGVNESSPNGPANQTPTRQSIPAEEIPPAETSSTPTLDPTVTAIPTRTPRPTGTPIGAQVTFPAESPTP